MKRKTVLRSLIGYAVLVWLFCAVFAVSAQAIDTPWLPLQPDSETTPEPVTDAPEPMSGEPRQETGEPVSDGSRQQEPEETPVPVTEPTATAPAPAGKRGCKGTVTGWAILIPVSFAVVRIGRKRR